MKKAFNFMSMFLTLAVALMMPLTLTSCGDDNEDEPNRPDDPNKAEYLNVAVYIDLGDAWYDFFDVSVTFTDVHGKNVTTTIDQDSKYVESVAYATAPTSYDLKIVATPKSPLPSVDDAKTYDFSKAITYSASSENAKHEQISILKSGSNSSTLKMAGTGVSAYASKPHDLINTTWTISK